MLELASAFVEGAKDDFVEMIYTVIINSFKVFLSIRHFPFVLTVFSITLLTILDGLTFYLYACYLGI